MHWINCKENVRIMLNTRGVSNISEGRKTIREVFVVYIRTSTTKGLVTDLTPLLTLDKIPALVFFPFTSLFGSLLPSIKTKH